MPIKKSLLEKILLYRVAKQMLLLFPFLIAIDLLLRKKVAIPAISQDNISSLLEKNVLYVVCIIIGLPLYYAILGWLWKSFLYVAFGGIEDDTIKIPAATVQNNQSVAGAMPAVSVQPAANTNNGDMGIGFLILIILIIYILAYSGDNPTPGPGPSPYDGSKCISTGCGKNWHCFGTYYVDGSKKSVNGCYPNNISTTVSSWSGTCRRCP